MGRLRAPKLPLFVYVRIAFLVVAIGASVMLYIRTSRLDGPSTSQLTAYLADAQLQVGTEIIDDYQQVYFEFDDQRIRVTSGTTNHMNPVTDAQFIVWTETPAQQNTSLIVLYDVLTKTRTQLTFAGTNLQPALDSNRVVWEDWAGERARIAYFDGAVTRHISEEYPSVRPSIAGNRIIYAQELGPDRWQTIVYDTDTGQSNVVTSGTQSEAGWPRFIDGDVVSDNPLD